MNKNKKFNISFFKIIICLLLILYSVMLLSLIGYTFVNSFKDPWDFIQDSVGIPKVWHFENYSMIIQNLTMQENVRAPIYYIEDLFLGSFLYSLLSSSAIVICTVMMAYACSQYKYKMSSIIYFIAMFVIVVPIVGSLPSEMRVVRELHFYNNLWATFILKFSFGNIYFLLLYQTFKGIPKDFKDAAEVDGASQLRIMVQIMIPMAIKIIGMVFLIQFVTFWNDYQTPLIYLPSVPNISVGMLKFSYSTNGIIAYEPFKLGACLIVMLPILIVFAIFQKQLLGNVMAGGVKG